MLTENVEVVQVMMFAVIQKRAFAEIPEIKLHHVVVGVEVDVGPHQPHDHTEYEGD